jgi:hypothetical protein
LINHKVFTEEVKDLVSQRLFARQILKIGDSTRIYNSDRISEATDMGTPAKADVSKAQLGNPKRKV